MTEPTKEEIREYLDKLRAGGTVNMFAAGSYLEDRFGLTKQEANRELLNWMKGK